MVPNVTSQAAKVRQGFADFLDEARLRPQYLKRRNYQYIVLPVETFDALFALEIEVKDIADDDGAHFTENKVFPDIIGFGASTEEALASFKEGLVAYAYEYYDRYSYYSVAPGRKQQAPLILRLISHFERHQSIDEIVSAA